MKRYRHFKGGIYELLHIAEHSETHESLVIYMSQDGKIYARPYEMFFEEVNVDGKPTPRFSLISTE